jgi:catechol 2,3-dioxygenase-like lactoylglutathione lyase family enzyme
MNAAIHHVNVTVPRAIEDTAKHFYGVVMGLQEVPKPEASRGRGGAWYQLGPIQLHLSIEDGLGDNLAEAEQKFRDAGVEIIPDDIPTPGWSRFYVRDPGGNRLEIAQAI